MENFRRPIQNYNGQNIRPTNDSLSCSNPYTIPRGNKCFCCSKLGHTSKQCPEQRRQKVNLATHAEENKEHKDKPYEDKDDIEEEEEQTYPDAGISLITQHLLYIPKKE